MSSFKVIRNGFPKAAIALTTGSKLATYRSARRIAAKASRAAPVDTGKLAGSIRSYANTVKAGARYSRFVEKGTNDTPAQPFFYDAVDGDRPQLEQDLMVVLLKAI